MNHRVYNHVKHLSQDSTIHFFPKTFLSKILVAKLVVRFICRCLLLVLLANYFRLDNGLLGRLVASLAGFQED